MKYGIFILLLSGILSARGINNLESKLLLSVSENDYINYADQALGIVSPAAILAMENISRFDLERCSVHAGIFQANDDPQRAQTAAAYLLRVSQVQQGEVGQEAYDYMMEQIDFGFYCYLYAYNILKDTSYLTAAQKAQIIQTIYDVTKYVAENSIRDGNTTNRNGWIISAAGVNESLRLFPLQPDFTQIKQVADNQWALLEAMGDADEEATHYNGLEIPYLLKCAKSRDIENSFYCDPSFRSMIERYLGQVSPVGVIPNYGDSYWSSLWGTWVGIFEKAAVVYNEGRYRRAAHRIFNYAKAQNFKDDNPETLTGLIYAVDDMNETLNPEPLANNSYVNNQRYRQYVPDKLALRNAGSYVHVDLYYGGTHGHPDGSAVIAYMDDTAVLLRNHNRPQNTEEYRNMLIIRDRDESFPFIEHQFLADTWQHSAIEMDKIRSSVGPVLDRSNITALNFSIYDDDAVNTVFDFYVDNIRGVKSDGSSIVIENFENGTNGWDGEIASDAVEGIGSLKKSVVFADEAAAEVVRLSWPETILPLDLSDCVSLEFDWKMTDNRIDPYWGAMLQFGSPGTQGSIRGQFTQWLRTMRRPQADLLADYGKASFAGIEASVVDYLGGRNIHRRDMVLSGGRFLWVRDKVTFGSDETCKIGPVWHLGSISESGSNWYRTYQDPVYDNWLAGAKDCIVYFAEQPGMIIAQDSATSQSPQYAVYQYKNAEMSAGQSVHFNTLLIPVEIPRSSDIVNDITVLFDNETASAIEIDISGVRCFASQSSVADFFEGGGFGTDALRSFAEFSENINYLCIHQGTSFSKDMQIFFNSSSPADAELYYDTQSARLHSTSGTLDIENASVVSLYFPVYPDELQLNSVEANFEYDRQTRMVTFNVDSGQSSIVIAAGDNDCVGMLHGDLNSDCFVDFFDLSQIGLDWLVQMKIYPDLSDDDIVNYKDFAIIADNWLAEYAEPSTALWLFDETSGTIAYDSTNGFDAGVNGNYSWQPDGGVYGGAIELSGNGSFVDVPDFDLTENWQISADIKVAASTAMMLCGNNLDTSNYIYIQGSTVRFKNSSGSQVSWSLPESLTGQWNNLKFAADASGVELFGNGVSIGRYDILPTLKFYTIGSGYTLNSYDYQGLIDNFNLYIQG